MPRRRPGAPRSSCASCEPTTRGRGRRCGWRRTTGSPSRGYTAVPTSPPGATRLLGLARANAIAVVPETTHTVVAGETLHCLLLDA